MCVCGGSCVSCNKMKQLLCQGEKLLIHIIAGPRRRPACAPAARRRPRNASRELGSRIGTNFGCSSSVPVCHLTHSSLLQLKIKKLLGTLGKNTVRRLPNTGRILFILGVPISYFLSASALPIEFSH